VPPYPAQVKHLFLQNNIISLFFFWQYWGSKSGSTPQATPPAHFCDGVFQDRVSQTICLGWLWTTIPLISVSWVARITGLSHWTQLKCDHFFMVKTFKTFYLFEVYATWLLSIVTLLGNSSWEQPHFPALCWGFNQGLACARQVLCHWAPPPAHIRTSHSYLTTI
jgi:hypothetical protein